MQSIKPQARGPYKPWTPCDCFGPMSRNIAGPIFASSRLVLFRLCILSTLVDRLLICAQTLLCLVSHLPVPCRSRSPGRHSDLVALDGNCTHLVSYGSVFPLVFAILEFYYLE